MASTCRDVGTLAFRKLGVLRSGGEMKAADAADALASLQSFYMESITGGAFGRVYNVQVNTAGAITPTGNQHINVLTEDEVTVDLPSSLPADYWQTWMPCRDYGWGLNVPLGGDPNVVVPRDKSVVMVTDEFNETRATYVYDGTVQRWLRIDTLDLNAEAPLSARSLDGLASVLALRMSEMFGSALASPMTIQAANRYKLALVSNFGNAEEHYF